MTGMRRVWSLALAIATLVGLSSAALVYFGMRAMGKPLTLGTAVLAGLPDWYFWAALTPLVFWLGQRFPLERERWIRVAGCFHGTLIIFFRDRARPPSIPAWASPSGCVLPAILPCRLQTAPLSLWRY